jgi:hypothetical protein
VKIERQTYSISVRAEVGNSVEVDRGTKAEGTQVFLADKITIEYERYGDAQWRWTSITTSGWTRFRLPMDHTWYPGDSLLPLWAVGLAYQYYPQGPDKKERS